MSEYFGTPSQRRLQHLGEALLRLMPDDARLCSHGRGVQVSSHAPGVLELAMDIARLTGLSALEKVPRSETPEVVAEFERAGFNTDVICVLQGARETVDLARERVEARPLPDDLSVEVIDRDSPDQHVRDFATVALANGVLPPAGSVLRGIARPGFGMVAYDADGLPVATAGSVLKNHPQSEEPKRAQWGQLATISERQGEGIAKTLGAMAIIHSHEHLGATGFKTGVRKGNVTSTRLCNALGLKECGLDIVAVMDPDAFREDKLTS